MIALYILLGFAGLIFLIVLNDLIQKKNTITRNFPLLGRLRDVFIKLGPPIRQYFISSNREELPFNRSQRNWIFLIANTWED